MGYEITQTTSEFRITGNGRDVLKALADLPTSSLHGFFNESLWHTTLEIYDALCWAGTRAGEPLDRPWVTHHLIQSLFRANRWNLWSSGQSYSDGIDFVGQKIGGESVILRAVAPFVQPGSFIAFRGEDGLEWRYLFQDRQMFIEIPDRHYETWQRVSGMDEVWKQAQV